MTLQKTLMAASAIFAVAVIAATPAAAQKKTATPAAAPAAPPAPPPLQLGPPIAGICVWSHDRVVGQSAAGQAAQQRMQQLQAQVSAELGPEKTAFETDYNAFRAQAASLPADQQTSKQQALAKRYQDLGQKAQLREKELEATLQKAVQKINGEIEPIVRGVIQARGCSLLLNADQGVNAANPQMDLTDSIVQQLNAKLPTLTFDREIIDPATLAQR